MNGVRRVATGVWVVCALAGAAPAWADVGASGASPHLAAALTLREAGDVAGASARVDAAMNLAADPALQWEAQLARSEIALQTGEALAVEAEARRLLAEAEAVFGPGTPRRAPPLVLLAQLRAAEGDSEAATGLLLQAARLARAGYAAGQGADGAAPPDLQAQADLFATLAALAEQLLNAGEGAAAALLAAELAVLGSDPPAGLPPRWQDAAAIGALAELRAGRPVAALARAAPLFQGDGNLGTDRARRLTDLLLAEVDAAAAAAGPPDEVISAWIDESLALQSDIAALEGAQMQGMGPMMQALSAGDALGADAAGRVALATVRADDPLVTTAYLALLAATLQADHPDLAAAWALRIAEMPAAYLASLASDPLPLMAELAADLRSRGDYPAAIAVGEAVALVAPLRASAGEADLSISALTELALTYTDAGATGDAAAIFDRALALIGDAGAAGPVPQGLAATAISALVGRAVLRQDLGDPAAAVADLEAARTLLRQTDEGLKPEAWLFVGAALRTALVAQGDTAAAEAALREMAERVEALAGSTSAEAAEGWFGLAQFLMGEGRLDDAAMPIRRAADAARAALPPDDPLALRVAVVVAAAEGDVDALLARGAGGSEDAALALAEAASAAAGSGDIAKAVAFLDRGIAALDPSAPTRAYFEAAKGDYLLRSGDVDAALPALREATRVLTRAERRGEPNARRHLPAHVTAALALSAQAEGVAAMNAFTEAFQVAQRVDDLSAGAALGRATARLMGSGPKATALARGLEDAEQRFKAARETYLAQLSGGADVTLPRQALTAAQGQLDAIRADIRAAFPDYAALADPRPLDLLATANLLGPEEVLLLYASADDESGDQAGDAPLGHVFAITADGFMAADLPPRADLARLAQDLRCAAALTDRRCGPGAGATRGAFSLDSADGQSPSEFDFALARDAWVALLQPVEAALAGKTSVIIVPDRTLSSLPFHLALTEAPSPDTTLRTAPWLLRKMAVTVVPSVSSLAALRNRDARASAADLPFLGVGDPLIGTQVAGPLPYDCGGVGTDMLLAAALMPGAGPLLRESGTADPMAIAALPALPDTRCELARNAATLGAASRVLIHADATERALKDMSDAGELARYRILSFATHGLIAGELGAANAGLVLTPPATADGADDGLLTVAEIAALRIDADFVILSACNTASGSSQRSEGLAGLAAGFFLAGARGLLVSHWPVYSDAATRLTTGMVAALAAPDPPGRAEALRQSALAILDDPDATAHEMHPAYWAPFMIVGDGRAGSGG